APPPPHLRPDARLQYNASALPLTIFSPPAAPPAGPPSPTRRSSDLTTGTFQFKVTDQAGGTLSANTATMTINIAADAGPTAVASSISATECTTYTVKVAVFKFTDAADVTPDTLGSITITSLPSDGTL